MYRNGIQGNSFAPIVGSGPNVNVWHYATNGRQYQDGDLVVMDYGGALDYLGVDITRTWPVAGKFDADQLKAYQCALEAQKAIIAAMKVGATRRETAEIGRAIYAKHGYPGGAGAGHYVGMTVHDVGDGSLPFQPGMVIAVEPIVEDVSKHLHVRIEDTVLITEKGPGDPHVGRAEGDRRGAGAGEAGTRARRVGRNSSRPRLVASAVEPPGGLGGRLLHPPYRQLQRRPCLPLPLPARLPVGRADAGCPPRCARQAARPSSTISTRSWPACWSGATRPGGSCTTTCSTRRSSSGSSVPAACRCTG